MDAIATSAGRSVLDECLGYLPPVLIESLQLDTAELAAQTGWELKPEGACKGDRCVPIPGGAPDGVVDARVVAEWLSMALVADERHGLWALGPESGGRVLVSAQMPELELPDRHGRPFSLESLRGTRVVMVAWASW
jgi:hypothetical protein